MIDWKQTAQEVARLSSPKFDTVVFEDGTVSTLAPMKVDEPWKGDKPVLGIFCRMKLTAEQAEGCILKVLSLPTKYPPLPIVAHRKQSVTANEGR